MTATSTKIGINIPLATFTPIPESVKKVWEAQRIVADTKIDGEHIDLTEEPSRASHASAARNGRGPARARCLTLTEKCHLRACEQVTEATELCLATRLINESKLEA